MGRLLSDLVEYMQLNNLSTGEGVDTFVDFEPASPDFAIMVNEYQGSPQPPFVITQHRSIQIKVRDKADNVEAVLTRINKLYALFRSDNHFIQLNEDRWGQFYLRQPPFKTGYDDNDRVIYSFNMGITTPPDVYA